MGPLEGVPWSGLPVGGSLELGSWSGPLGGPLVWSHGRVPCRGTHGAGLLKRSPVGDSLKGVH
jgi:hypothetical protein